MAFKKAIRENIWVKILEIASSGGGKTYSALRMATGFAKELSKLTGVEERIAFIDSESRRSTYYADEFEFDILEIKAPFEPEKYAEAIEEAIEAGYKVLVLDSMTHEWSGKGGCLEIHSKIPGNSYTAWGKVTPRHEAFLDKIIDSPIHIFATVRGDDKYILEDVNGKQIPRKVPVGYDQRKNTEYLFTASFMLEQDTHISNAVKDNTHIFENRNDVLSEKHGEMLCQWANSGDVTAKKKQLDKEKEDGKLKMKMQEEEEAKELENSRKKANKKEDATSTETISLPNAIKQIDKIAREKAKENKDAVAEAIKKYHATANYNNIEDLQVALNVLSALKNI
jgi:hypothetical protein